MNPNPIYRRVRKGLRRLFLCAHCASPGVLCGEVFFTARDAKVFARFAEVLQSGFI